MRILAVFPGVARFPPIAAERVLVVVPHSYALVDLRSVQDIPCPSAGAFGLGRRRALSLQGDIAGVSTS